MMTTQEIDNGIARIRARYDADVKSVQSNSRLLQAGRRDELKRLHADAKRERDALAEQRARMVESNLERFRSRACGGAPTPERRQIIAEIEATLAKGSGGHSAMKRYFRRAESGDIETKRALAAIAFERALDPELADGNLLENLAALDSDVDAWRSLNSSVRGIGARLQDNWATSFPSAPPAPAADPPRSIKAW